MIGRTHGFSLIELVLVIVLLSIVATTASLRMGNSNTSLGAQAEQLASDIRYTQSLSQTRGQRHCISFTASSYTITNNNCVTAVALPSSPNPVLLAGNITLAWTNNLITFSALGRPFTDAAATTALGPAAAVLTLSAGGDTLTVTVTPETGRVTVP